MNDSGYERFIEKIREQSDIVTVISDYVSLKKKGKNYWGCCPFHSEKTPSFSVTPDKGFFYCFGCQSGGNVFNFLMKVENLSFIDAAKLLAHKLNIPLPEKEKSAQELAREREMARLFHANELAKDFFYACLTKTRFGQEAKKYLTERGLTDAIIEEFQLGFALPTWDKLAGALQKRDISSETLVKAGLIGEKQSGGYYDRFRNRIMFPIHDIRGRLVGFGGRIMDDSQPKYLNSPETAVFNKRHILYNIHRAEKYIKQTGQAIVVEGYMDAIAVFSAGVKNVVASMGTAFTPEQAKQLRAAHEIIFAYDSDAAGQQATVKALETVRKLGLSIKVMVLPEGKDPDEFIRKQGTAAFTALVADSMPLLDYQIHRAMLESDCTTLEGKVAAVGKIVPVLASSDNAVEVNAHLTQVAQQLLLDEGAIRTELSKYMSRHAAGDRSSRQDRYPTALAAQQVSASEQAERNMIRVMYEDQSVIPYIEAQLTDEDIEDVKRKKIMKMLFAAYNNEENIRSLQWQSQLQEAEQAELSCIMLIDIQLDNILKLVEDCIKTIRLTSLRKQYETHRLRADELQRMGDSSFLQELAKSQRINDEIIKLRQS